MLKRNEQTTDPLNQELFDLLTLASYDYRAELLRQLKLRLAGVRDDRGELVVTDKQRHGLILRFDPIADE